MKPSNPNYNFVRGKEQWRKKGQWMFVKENYIADVNKL